MDNLPTRIDFTANNNLLTVDKLNTSKVTNMSHMFSQCSKLTSLDVSCLVFTALIIINPFYMYNLGFILSFASTFLIILISTYLKDKSNIITLGAIAKEMKKKDPSVINATIGMLFDEEGKLLPELQELAPKGDRRMGSNPHTNGGKLLKDLILPDPKLYKVEVEAGVTKKQDMIELGKYIRDVFRLNAHNKNFRIFGPDETMSNRLKHTFETERRSWMADMKDNDEFLAHNGRVMDSMLSENMCQGWLEGYLLTGRHGFFSTYEAFSRVIDSMTSQHSKWLKIVGDLPWREDIASLNYILTSYVWQQDHNGYTHQEPGFLNHLATKKSDIARIYLPADTNTLLCTMHHCLGTKNRINAIVASKHPRTQFLNMDQAQKVIWRFGHMN